jgi:hypothetical protein
MSHGTASPSHRFTAPTWMRAMTAVLALAFPAAAIGLVLSEGWSGMALVSVALVPLGLLGVVESFGRRMELYPDHLVVVANLRRRSYARSAFVAASWAKGVPVALEYVGGGYLRLPEVGASTASVGQTLRAWLERPAG